MSASKSSTTPKPSSNGTSASASNTTEIAIDPLARIFLSGFANASHIQRITITDKDSQNVLAVLEGSGENTALKVTKHHEPLLHQESHNGKVVDVSPSCKPRILVAQFDFKKDPQGNFLPSKVSRQKPVGSGYIRNISINSTESSASDADNDVSDSQLKVDIVRSKWNPARIRIPKNTCVRISCMANARNDQIVRWHIKDDSKNWGQFSGAGEDVSMATSNDSDTYSLKPASVDRELLAVFSYLDKNGREVPADRVTRPVVFGDDRALFTTVNSEDGGSKKDRNDAVLRVAAISTDFCDEED